MKKPNNTEALDLQLLKQMLHKLHEDTGWPFSDLDKFYIDLKLIKHKIHDPRSFPFFSQN